MNALHICSFFHVDLSTAYFWVVKLSSVKLDRKVKRKVKGTRRIRYTLFVPRHKNLKYINREKHIALAQAIISCSQSSKKNFSTGYEI